MKNGTYAFRFSGFTMTKDSGTYYLVGVGAMTITDDPDKKSYKIVSSGEQSSSITRLFVMGQAITNAKFKLVGTIADPVGGVYHASITFDRIAAAGEPAQELVGEFDFVESGTGFWMISTRTYDNTQKINADEVMSGEAVFLR